MALSFIDWLIVAVVFLTALGIGIFVSRRSGKDTREFFLSGKNMPWWLLGFSMVATTFSTDTPNLVTDIVRQNGIAGNWVWWAFLLTGMLTVFVYARLWRKSAVDTDMEFYELRYSGFGARFLRAFRSIYLGLFFNVLAMSGVTLAAIKIGEVMLGLEPWLTVVIAASVTMVFSALGGFRGVVYSDFLLFFLAMVGSVGAAIVAIDIAGGLDQVLQHELVKTKTHMLPPADNWELLTALFIIPIAIQWWNAWYPGAEPGGGGYVAQRMLAAKDEGHAINATFFFNILHYAARPWPWILVALASLVVFPDLESLQQAFPNVSEGKLGHDMAYPAMLTMLPTGLLGLVMASLVAAYMSTISTHLNWGSSYLINDVYKRFLRPQGSEKEFVLAGRLSTVLLMIFSALLALYLQNALQLFDIILMFGAGTGLIYILRWFWWRINAWTEISAMFTSGIVSILFAFGGLYPESFPDWGRLPLVALITGIVWLLVTFLTRPEDKATLRNFYKKIQPGGPGWKKVLAGDEEEGILDSMILEEEQVPWQVPTGILAMVLGCILVYSILFALGGWILGHPERGILFTAIAVIAAFLLSRMWGKIKTTLDL